MQAANAMVDLGFKDAGYEYVVLDDCWSEMKGRDPVTSRLVPNTTKFQDLGRDPRFCLHTATVDPNVSEGDAKLWGQATNLQDQDLHQRFATDLFEESGMDLRGQPFDPFYVADLTGASSLALEGDQLAITI